jgi:K+-transporting ATPase ATPase C chain
MLQHIRPAIVMIVCMTIITGLAYPLAMTGIAQAIFPYQANGSLIERDGKVIGSARIGQNFTGKNYFHGRPSATTDTDPNDSSKVQDRSGSLCLLASSVTRSTSALDVGPRVRTGRVGGVMLKAENPETPVPADLVTTSASGLDPDISPAAAPFQVPQVAKARGRSHLSPKRTGADTCVFRSRDSQVEVGSVKPWPLNQMLASSSLIVSTTIRGLKSDV